MSKVELTRLLKDILAQQKLSRRTVSRLANVANSNIGKFLNHQKAFSLDGLIKVLDALDLKLVIEDKNVNWGTDIERIRVLPKKLFHGERIEVRDYVRTESFEGRVDLFQSIDEVLKFIPTPCDVYEIHPKNLIRKNFDVVDHPFGKIYSYHGDIPAEAIRDRVTLV